MCKFVSNQLGMLLYAQKKENGKRRKVEEQNAFKKSKDRKVSYSSSSIHHCNLKVDQFWCLRKHIFVMWQVVDVEEKNLMHLRLMWKGGMLLGLCYCTEVLFCSKLHWVCICISIAGKSRSTHKTSSSSSSKATNAYVHSTSTPYRQWWWNL